MNHEILVYNKTAKRAPKKFIVSVILKALEFLKLKQPAELAVLIVSPLEIRRLNKIWRRKNEAVDELSFGLNSRKLDKFAKGKHGMVNLGEIVINGRKISDRAYLAELLIHSLLHLLGYSHGKSAASAAKMERLESKIFKHLNI